LWAAALAVCVALGAYQFVGRWHAFDFLDLQIYRTGGTAWLRGVPLYGPDFPSPLHGPRFPFTYPPLAAAVFGILTLLPLALAEALVAISTAVACAVCLDIALRTCGHGRLPGYFYPVAAIAAVAFEPVRSTISFGQINVYLMLLVMTDCLVVPRRYRGYLTGVAAAIKLTPAAFVVYFVAAKDWRAVRCLILAFLGAGLLGLALAPGDSLRYWGHVLFDSNRIGDPAYATNQSLQGLLSRSLRASTGTTLLWAASVAILAALAFITARHLLHTGNRVAALSVVALWQLLASPVSWSHHWVWILPGLVALASLTVRTGNRFALTGVGVYATAFTAAPFMWPPRRHDVETHWTTIQWLAGDTYTLLGLATLVTTAGIVTVHQRAARPDGPPPLEPARAGTAPEPLSTRR
jgi:alpha-1,2-mannosyltransferase